MCSTPEYKTLISLTAELRRAVQFDLVSLSDDLVAKHLISPNTASQLRNQTHSEAERAAELVGYIQNKVQQNPQHYHTFVQILENQDQEYYCDILNKLRGVHQQHGGNCQQPLSPLQGHTGIEHSDIKQRHLRTGTNKKTLS